MPKSNMHVFLEQSSKNLVRDFESGKLKIVNISLEPFNKVFCDWLL